MLKEIASGYCHPLARSLQKPSVYSYYYITVCGLDDENKRWKTLTYIKGRERQLSATDIDYSNTDCKYIVFYNIKLTSVSDANDNPKPLVHKYSIAFS